MAVNMLPCITLICVYSACTIIVTAAFEPKYQPEKVENLNKDMFHFSFFFKNRHTFSRSNNEELACGLFHCNTS